MTRPVHITPYLSEPQAILVIDALRSTKSDAEGTAEALQLASRIWRDLADARKDFAENERHRLASEALLAERAKNATLTKTQAEALAAVRDKGSPFYRLETMSRLDRSARRYWRKARSMGGARRRMVETLVEEGLLNDRRELTEGGRERLAAWEQKHGTIGEVE